MSYINDRLDLLGTPDEFRIEYGFFKARITQRRQVQSEWLSKEDLMFFMGGMIIVALYLNPDFEEPDA